MLVAHVPLAVATPTEASGVGVAGAIVLAAANRRLTLDVVRQSIFSTTKTASFIFAIFVGATAFSVVLRGLGGDQVIEETLTGLPFGPDGILITILFAVFLLGFFLDWVEITLIIQRQARRHRGVRAGRGLGRLSGRRRRWNRVTLAGCLSHRR